MSLTRVFAGALFSGSILTAGPVMASHAERQDQVRSVMQDREVDRAADLEQSSSDWLATISSTQLRSDQGRLPAYANSVPDLTASAIYDSATVLSALPQRSNSTVPLPTGLSLFGAGLLTLGLISFVAGGERRLAAAEAGRLMDLENGCDPAEAIPSIRFRIEIQSDRGGQIRHVSSARGTIDLIADLLNEGWEIACIRDGRGLSVDYEDVLEAWHSERAGDRKRVAALS